VIPSDGSSVLLALDAQRERCLLFVACTRAREDLAASWHGRPSPFLTMEHQK
jgi:superfamily I DNA/RNA helicase